MLRLLLRGVSAVVLNSDMSSDRWEHRCDLARAQHASERYVRPLALTNGIRITKSVGIPVLLTLVAAMSSPVWAVSDPLARLRFTGSQSLPIKAVAFAPPQSARSQPIPAAVETPPETVAAQSVRAKTHQPSRRRKRRGAKRKVSAPALAVKPAPKTAAAQASGPSLLGLFPTSKTPRWAREVFRRN